MSHSRGAVLAQAGKRPIFQAQRTRTGMTSSGTASGTATLGRNPGVGTVLIAIVKATCPGGLSDYTDPGGWTIIHSATGTNTTTKVYGKLSAGSGDVSYTQNFGTTVTNIQVEYQEWAGLRDPAGTLHDSANDVTLNDATGTTTWDPAASDIDVTHGVYLAIACLNSGSGTVTSDWSGADSTNGTASAYVLCGWKVVTDGSAWDTAVTWTNSRTACRAVLPLRGIG